MTILQLAPVYVSWTSKVTDNEGQAVIDGVADVIKVSKIDREIKVFGSTTWAEGNYGCADWYQDRSRFQRSFGKSTWTQIGLTKLHWLLTSEPWQKQQPHTDIMIVDEDICDEYDPNLYFLFGAESMGNYVQSVFRFREGESDEQIRLQLIRRTARHEFGHTYGLPSVGRRNTVEFLGPHCKNVCSMRQGSNVMDWRKLYLEEESAGVIFCRDCLKDLEKFRKR